MTRTFIGLLAIVAGALLATPAEPQGVQASYIYSLASFTGPIRQDFSRVTVDRERNEVYVLYQNVVRVFNESGMEVYHFGDDLELGHIVDLAIDEHGDILLLSYRDGKLAIVRCDYRGRPQAAVALKGLPAELSEFAPNRMAYRGGKLALGSTIGLQVVVADREGHVQKSHDLFALFELKEEDRGNVEISGFDLDTEGNLLLTVPVLFRAFVLSPQGKLAWFGKASGAPGGFNVVAGIGRDSKGNFLVVDRLKGAVLVFDKAFGFVTQFATRGYRPGELIFPNDLAIDRQDRVYVTQTGRRGVSVFKLTYL